jgi:hypothetical protein
MSMKTLLCAFSLALFAAPAARAQEMPKPGPEHEVLKKLEGTWEATMKAEGMESKGTMVYKMEMGGLWLTSAFDGNFAGMKFSGRGLDTYDSTKKKYVGATRPRPRGPPSPRSRRRSSQRTRRSARRG